MYPSLHFSPVKTVDLIDPLSYPDATRTTTATSTTVPSTTVPHSLRTPNPPIRLARCSTGILLSIPSHAVSSAVYFLHLCTNPSSHHLRPPHKPGLTPYRTPSPPYSRSHPLPQQRHISISQNSPSTYIQPRLPSQLPNVSVHSALSRNASPTFALLHRANSASPAERYLYHECNKSFSRPSSLQIHTFSHIGEKLFLCLKQGCTKRFSVTRTGAISPQCRSRQSPIVKPYISEITDPPSTMLQQQLLRKNSNHEVLYRSHLEE